LQIFFIFQLMFIKKIFFVFQNYDINNIPISINNI